MQLKSTLAVVAVALVLAVAGCPRNNGATTTTTTPPPPQNNVNISNAPSTSTEQTPSSTATPPAATPPAAPSSATGQTQPGATPPTATPPAPGTPPPPAPPADPNSGEKVVILETTKGNIEITLHPDWAPNGVSHFLELVNAGYYNDAPWFRIVPDFMAQVGISGRPELTQKWSQMRIPADPLVKGNQRGFVTYGMGSNAMGPDPGSRSTHIFINFKDNSFLDQQGFAAFGEVTSGMDVVDKLFVLPDEALAQVFGPNQGQMALGTQEGLDKFKKAFPEADYIKSAHVK